MAKSNGPGATTSTSPIFNGTPGGQSQPQGLLAGAPATGPDPTAGLLSLNPAPTAPGPGMVPGLLGASDPNSGAGVGKTLLEMEAARNAAAGLAPPVAPPAMTLGQQLAALGGSTVSGQMPVAPPQTVAPPVEYTDHAIALDGPLQQMPKTVPQAAPVAAPRPTGPQTIPPAADPDSATPLAQSNEVNQQALMAALARLRARAGTMGAYQ